MSPHFLAVYIVKIARKHQYQQNCFKPNGEQNPNVAQKSVQENPIFFNKQSKKMSLCK